MNRIYQLVWNRALKVLQVASELTHSYTAAVVNGDSPRPSRTRRPLFSACATALALGAVATISPAWAANTGGTIYIVTQATDDGSGNTAGSLSWAIDQANANPGSFIVISLPSGTTTITETGTLPNLTANTVLRGTLQIVGASAAPLTISQSSTLQLAGSIVGAAGASRSGTSDHGVGAVTGGFGTTLDVLANGAVAGGAGGAGASGGNGGAGGAGIIQNRLLLGANNGLTATNTTNAGSITGGAGGAGGAHTGGILGNGGNGGNGGMGFNGNGFSLTNSGTIAGGAGGAGGTSNGNGGNGGNGGTAISGNNFTLTNQAGGQIIGGAGGAAGSGAVNGQAGSIGTAVAATGNSTVTNAGTLSGATAVAFSGGGNTLLLEIGSTTTGNITSSSGSTNGGDTLILGDNANGGGSGSLNLSNVSGFASYEKTGTGTWTLTGTGTDWQVQDGTLQVVGSGALGSVTLANGGTLDNAGSISSLGTGVTSTSTTATINNHNGGTIAGFLAGIDVTGGGTIANSGQGSAIGGGLIGINADAPVTVNNTNGATILGEDGIALRSGGTVLNGSGSTIQASTPTAGDCVNGNGTCSIAALGALTLSNAGTLIGNVQMDSSAANLTTLSAGGVIQGDLNIGSNTASTLTLDGDNATAQAYSQAVTGKTTFAGNLIKSGSGTWVVDSNDLASVAGTTINAGTLQVGNGGTIGSIGNGNVADNGALVFDRSDAVNFAGTVSGTGSLIQQGSGTLVLTGANTYSGGTTISAGTLQVGNGTQQGGIGSGTIADNGALVFDNPNATTVGSAITGNGSLTQQGSGTLILNGSSSYSGLSDVQNGTLVIGDASNPAASIAGNVQVDNGATLSGFGSAGGTGSTVTVASGGILAPGSPGNTGNLSVGGNLVAAQGSVLNFDFGSADASFSNIGDSDSVSAGGNLALNGATLNVINVGGMGAGLYTMLSYGGTLTETNGGLTLGTTPAGQSLFLQNLIGQKQINLIDSTGYTLNVWNANGQASSTQLGGGSGTWSMTSPEWTDVTGTVPNAPAAQQSDFALFGGTPGTVTVDDSAGMVNVAAMQFSVNGYTLTGDALTLVPNSSGNTPTIRVGDGSRASTAMKATIDNVLAGSNGLTKIGLGTLVLAGANTYSGGTTINGGTLSVSNDGNLGAASGGVTFNGGTLENTAAFTTARNVLLAGNGTLQTDASLGVSGVISGSGALAKTGNGTLTLTGANTYSGGTAINGGTLSVSNDGNLGAAAGRLTFNGGTLENTAAFATARNVVLAGNGTLQTNANLGVSGVISGSGALAKTGNGTLTLTGANTYSGGTAINGGTLQVGNGARQGSIGSGNIADNGSLVFDNPSATMVGSAISGTGTLTQQGSGTLTLTGANSYSGGTAINGGTLQVGNGARQGSIGSGDIADNGSLVFDNPSATTVGSAITGTGTLTQQGSGTLTLTGVNTYSGGTAINGGTLSVSNDGNLGAAAGGVTFNGGILENSAAFTTTRNDVLAGNGTLQTDANLVASGTISGTGVLTKTGNGALVLDGDSSAFTGSTTVQSGMLEVGDAATPSATFGGNVSVDAGATLRGHGSIGGNVVSDGTVWAGGSIGTLTIGGNYTQNADGTLEVEATPQGQSSLLAIHGAASLAGSVLVLADNSSWAPRTEYTILTADGGVNGQFASASDNFAFLNPVLTYQANAVELSLQRNDVNFNSLAQTSNERAVATTANALGFGNPVYDALVILDAATAPRAFNQLSGEIHASTRTAIADNDHYVRDAISQHLASQDNNANGLKVTDADGVTAWTSAWGRLGSHDGNGNASAMDDNGSGLLFGADMPVDGSTRIGAVVGTGVGTARISALASSSHVVDQHLGIYGSTQTGALLWQGAGIYGWQRVDTTRFMGFGSFSGTAASSYHAHTAQAYVDASLPIMLGSSTTLAPFANVAVERVSTPTIQENGTPAALSVAAQDSTIGYGTLGLRSTFDLGAPNHGLHAHVSVGWQHAWGDTLPVDAMRFQSGGDSFDIAGLPLLRNAGVVNAGLSFTVAPNVSVDTSYQGQFGKRANDQSARISLDWKF